MLPTVAEIVEIEPSCISSSSNLKLAMLRDAFVQSRMRMSLLYIL